MLDQLMWVSSCCAWHGEYAEYTSAKNEVFRIKKGPSIDGYLVMCFADNKCTSLDENEIPQYILMTEDELRTVLD